MLEMTHIISAKVMKPKEGPIDKKPTLTIKSYNTPYVIVVLLSKVRINRPNKGLLRKVMNFYIISNDKCVGHTSNKKQKYRCSYIAVACTVVRAFTPGAISSYPRAACCKYNHYLYNLDILHGSFKQRLPHIMLKVTRAFLKQ